MLVHMIHVVHGKGGNLWLYKEYEESPLELCRTLLLTVDVRALSLWGVAGGMSSVDGDKMSEHSVEGHFSF
jgi:hypothetical protein